MQRYLEEKMWKKCWLFHATDFQSLMYPCFIICRLLGLFPYKINASTFEASKPGYVVSTVIICVSCGFDVSVIHNFILKINLESTIKTLEAISFYTLYGFILIITYIFSGAQMRLLQNILKISLKLSPELYQKLSRWIHFKDIFGTIFLIVQVSIYFYKIRPSEVNDSDVILVTMFTVHMTVLVFQINMIYMNCVCVLKACFMRINENVACMQKIMVNDIKTCVPRLICPIPRNEFLLIKLKLLKKEHLIVCDAMRTLNIIFSPQLLAAITIIMSNSTFELYFYVVRWQDGLRISFDWQFVDVFILSMLFYIIKIILLVWACETSKKQILELGITVHEVLNSTRDEEVKDELQLFSLQILHQKDIFSAKGITVDSTLLTTIVGNVTMYMLILIQFLIGSHSCDENFGYRK